MTIEQYAPLFGQHGSLFEEKTRCLTVHLPRHLGTFGNHHHLA